MHDNNVKFVRHFRGLLGVDALPYLLFFYFNNYLVYRGRRKIKQRKTKTKTHKQTKTNNKTHRQTKTLKTIGLRP